MAVLVRLVADRLALTVPATLGKAAAPGLATRAGGTGLVPGIRDGWCEAVACVGGMLAMGESASAWEEHALAVETA